MRRRVVVTGAGCVTPLGNDVETMWRGLMEGRSAVGPTTLFDASSLPTRISAEVRDFDVSHVGEDPERWHFQARHTRFAVAAAKQAGEASGVLEKKPDPTRFVVYLGSGEGQQDFDRFTQMMLSALEGENLDVARFTKKG